MALKWTWNHDTELDLGRKARLDFARHSYSRELIKLPGWSTDSPVEKTRELESQSLTVYAGGSSQLINKSSEPTERPQWQLRKVITGHKGWVQCLAASENGEWLASGSADTLLKLWNPSTGKLLASFTGHKGGLRALCTDPLTLHHLFSAGEDRSARLWDLTANSLVRDFYGHSGGVYTLAYMPELEALATAGRDKTIRIWDLRAPEPMRILYGHSDSITCLNFRKSEPVLVSASQDRSIRFWDLVNGHETLAMAAHHRSIRCLVSSETQMWSAGADGVRRWEMPSGKYLAEAEFGSSDTIVHSLSASSDFTYIASGSDDGMLRIFDYNSGGLTAQSKSMPMPGSDDSESAILATLFAPNSNDRIYTGDMDKTIKVWERKGSDTETLKPRLALTL